MRRQTRSPPLVSLLEEPCEALMSQTVNGSRPSRGSDLGRGVPRKHVEGVGRLADFQGDPAWKFRYSRSKPVLQVPISGSRRLSMAGSCRLPLG